MVKKKPKKPLKPQTLNQESLVLARSRKYIELTPPHTHTNTHTHTHTNFVISFALLCLDLLIMSRQGSSILLQAAQQE